jgi:hypothetical protein
VVDRRKLEESDSECYGVVSGECSRRLPAPLTISVTAVERQRQGRRFSRVNA